MYKRRTDQEWLSLIEQCQASSLTQQAFCQKHDISVSTFYAKRQTLSVNGVKKLSKTHKEVADKLKKSKINKIAREEAIRQTVRTTIENNNAAITALKSQIKEALDNDNATTAKILMEALDKIKTKD